MWHVLIEPSPDDLPFESARITDMRVKSLDAAAALLHMISQAVVCENEILSVQLLNSNENEKTSSCAPSR